MTQQEIKAKKIKQAYKSDYTIKETERDGDIYLNMSKGTDFFNREFITAVIHGDGHIDWY